jgi:hypothetical protein
MFFDLVQVAVLLVLAYLTYKQGDRIDDLETMMGYILGNLGGNETEKGESND